MAVLNSVMPAGHWALQIESILGFSAEKGYGNEPSKGREGNASATVQQSHVLVRALLRLEMLK